MLPAHKHSEKHSSQLFKVEKTEISNINNAIYALHM